LDIRVSELTDKVYELKAQIKALRRAK